MSSDTECTYEKYRDIVTFLHRVNHIEPTAVEWLIKHESNRISRVDNLRLDCLFSWKETPQGTNYWQNISEALEEQ